MLPSSKDLSRFYAELAKSKSNPDEMTTHLDKALDSLQRLYTPASGATFSAGVSAYARSAGISYETALIQASIPPLKTL